SNAPPPASDAIRNKMPRRITLAASLFPSRSDELLQHSREAFRFAANAVFQLGQLALQLPQVVGKMQARQNGDVGGIRVGGLRGDGEHEIVHASGKRFYLAWIAGGA